VSMAAAQSLAKGQLISQPQEAPTTPPRDHIIPVWYPAENNWNACIQEMAESFRETKMEFSGNFSQEQRMVEATMSEQLQNKLFRESSGRLGAEYKPHTRTATVKDIFQDTDFPASSASWYRGSKIPDYTTLYPPARWKRLQELVMDTPYPTASPGNGGFIPRAGRVYQGALEDFYLVAGMQTVGMKPWLIGQIFADMQFSSPNIGVFILRLYKHGQWHHVKVDGALPMDKGQNPLCSRSEFFPAFSWPSIIEKAYAKLHGSWEGLGGGGHVEEVLTDLTGGCSTRFGTADVAQDRLWQYLYTMQNACLFGCNINDKECSRRRIPMEQHWASSIFKVDKFEGIPYVCVCVAAPTYAVSRMPHRDVPSAEGYGVSDGFVWLRIDDFVTLFDTIYECRLVNSDLGQGQPYTPGWMSGTPYYEEMWAFQGDVFTETAPSFLMEILDVPTEITMEITQTDLRYGDSHDTPELGRPMQAPLLLRFFQCSADANDKTGGEIYMVHLSAWGHTRDASTSVKVYKPGKYLAMVSVPGKYTCHRMIFRCYTSRPIVMKPITQHRSWIAVNPAMPLNATPWSLCGFQRVDSLSEQLPQMFDEASGRGQPMANAQISSSGGGASPGGVRGAVEQMGAATGLLQGQGGRRIDPNNPEGIRTVGTFGGEGAVASVNAAESQGNGCSLM